MSSPSHERGAIRAALQQQGERCPYCSMPSHLGRELHAGYCVVEKARSELAALEALVAVKDFSNVTIYEELQRVEAENADLRAQLANAGRDIARPLDEYHEDLGPVLWWTLPVREPPYVGTTLDIGFPDGITHFTPCRDPLNAGDDPRVSADSSKERNDA